MNGVDASGKVNMNKKSKYAFDKLQSSTMSVSDAKASSRNLLQNMSKTASGDKPSAYAGSKRNLLDSSGKSSLSLVKKASEFADTGGDKSKVIKRSTLASPAE